MTEPKAFQVATIRAALKGLGSSKTHRHFLVADEVGLGKTVVAQGVIREMMSQKRRDENRPLVVLYVCSSLAIAAQNRRKLLEVLPKSEWPEALCTVDRLTLVGTSSAPRHRELHLYTLTPETSIPRSDGRTRKGLQSERALIFALLKHRFPKLVHVLRQDAFRLKPIPAADDIVWRQWVHYYKRLIQENATLRKEFYSAVRQELGLRDGEWLLRALEPFATNPPDLIGRLRSALAAANLSKLNPDLVIFDEFQRFRALVQEYEDTAEDKPSRVLQLLRGEEMADPPGLLLLSATPYKPYARRWEEADGGAHRTEFLQLVKFLYGNDAKADSKRRDCEVAFQMMETELRLGRLESDEFRDAKQQIEALLRPIMSRTERMAHPEGSRTSSVLSWEDDLRLKGPDLHGKDLQSYKCLAVSFRDSDKSWAVPYWDSIPLPLQTLGPGYVAWKNRQTSVSPGPLELTTDDRKWFRRPNEWPQPKMRALERLIPPETLVLPWIAPSLPWWSLGGRWKKADLTTSRMSGKLLLFSRFRAVPPSVTALLSYGLECRFAGGGKVDYESITQRRVLQPRPNREALLAFFHPSPWLVKVTEPLSSKSRTESGMRRELARQIRSSLQEAGIQVKGESRRPVWKLLGAIESRMGVWKAALRGWQDIARRTRVEDSDGGLIPLLRRWDQEGRLESVEQVSPAELEKLAYHALSAPGVVLGRALARHWPEAVSSGFGSTLDAAWSGLRTYLDQPWFVKALGGGERHYPESLQKAITEGNLESVLDEHLWVTSRLQGTAGNSLASELKEVLGLRSSVSLFHAADGKDRFRLRCHAALPFTEGRTVNQLPGDAEEKPLRPDELRKAFNSPFWPHVLATTSIGQEGLDFHCWCKTLAHWDLASDPVSHEQRQGRIQRFAGIAVRAAIAGLLGNKVLSPSEMTTSPWVRLAEIAENELADSSGLKPWWILEGAETRNVLFSVPTSEQEAKFRWLQEQVLLYRLAIGHPNQEDLLEVLQRDHQISREQVRAASLELSAYFGASTSDG
jgi:hypothetical protein